MMLRLFWPNHSVAGRWRVMVMCVPWSERVLIGKAANNRTGLQEPPQSTSTNTVSFRRRLLPVKQGLALEVAK